MMRRVIAVPRVNAVAVAEVVVLLVAGVVALDRVVAVNRALPST